MKKSYSYNELSDKVCITKGCTTKIKKRLEDKNDICYKCYKAQIVDICFICKTPKVYGNNFSQCLCDL